MGQPRGGFYVAPPIRVLRFPDAITGEGYYRPRYINPYGIGASARATPGLIEYPLLNLQINPAWFNSDCAGTNQLYVDFRNYRQTATFYQPRIYPMYSTNVAVYMPPIMYPYYLVNSRPIIEPIISAAFLTDPLPSTLSGLHLGFTYQGIMQDTKYYTIPFDIYQSNLGYDYRGTTIASSSLIPVTTVSSGEDEMHYTGNLFSLYAGYGLLPNVKLGLNAGRAVFNGDGSYGNRTTGTIILTARELHCITTWRAGTRATTIGIYPEEFSTM